MPMKYCPECGTKLDMKLPREQAREMQALRSYPKRKLSAWNKYVKANANKPRFRYRDGKLNLKKMAVAFRKTPQGKKKRR
jgi:ssDNA-binding Zn-finger/Zn-ribbon topoisomerase 1